MSINVTYGVYNETPCMYIYVIKIRGHHLNKLKR